MDLTLELAPLIASSARARAQLNAELSHLGTDIRIIDGIAPHLFPDVPVSWTQVQARMLLEKCEGDGCEKHHVVNIQARCLSVENFEDAPWEKFPYDFCEVPDLIPEQGL